MNIQCQGCGSFAGGEAPTASCGGCGSVICSRCLAHHKQGCEQVQTKKRLGQGPTVRVILEQPVEVPAAEPVTLPSLEPSPEVAQAVQEIMTKDFSLPAQWTPRPEPTVFDSAVLEQMKTDGTVVDATIPAVAEEPEAPF